MKTQSGPVADTRAVTESDTGDVCAACDQRVTGILDTGIGRVDSTG